MALFEGAGIAPVIPLKEDGEVNHGKLEKTVEEQITGGIGTITACGTTGEVSTMVHEGHLDVIEYICKITEE